jgi:uncharacterized protein
MPLSPQSPQPLEHTSSAPGAQVWGLYRPVPLTAVTIADSFWETRIRVNREQTLPHVYRLSRETGRIEAFKLDWKPGVEPVPHIFWVSDVAKWIEAASYSLAAHPDPALDALLDETISLVVNAQQSDGYLNPYFTVVKPEQRWTNLRDMHELYCAGHLIEAGVTHFQATGKRVLLDAVCRYVDYIDTVFGTQPGKKRGYPGHEEIELALVKLCRITGEKRYLRLSQYFVDERGRQPHYFDIEAQLRGEAPGAFWAKTYEYNQSHFPVREQSEVVGHAVRAMYLYSAMADLGRELGDNTLLQACRRLWNHLCAKRMYITGGIGSSWHNEGLTRDYDLPNESAYAETCAAIGLILWSHRMLQLDCDAHYADVLERVLYNGMLSGVSLDGHRFFYENPLTSLGNHHRQEWYDCACCPPNIARLLASLGQYIYASNDTQVVVHLYIQSSARLALDGREITVRQETTYPWAGTITIQLGMNEPTMFGLNLRIPGWCRTAHLSVNGASFDLTEHVTKGYARVERLWQSGDRVILDLAMPVERVYAHPDVRQDAGCVALQRGPLVYCLEAVDHAVPLHRIVLPRAAELASHFEPGMLGGIVVITGTAQAADDTDWEGMLYRSWPVTAYPCTITAIPYYAWDNRAPGEMRVWLQAESLINGLKSNQKVH